jgi:hypothetical protein
VSDGRADRQRLRYQVIFWLWLLLGVGNLARAAFRLAVRDELWGLAVAFQGALGLIFLGLAWGAWSRLSRGDHSGLPSTPAE